MKPICSLELLRAGSHCRYTNASSHDQRVGFEPTPIPSLEPDDGYAPSPLLYQSSVLLFAPIRQMEHHEGIAPSTSVWKTDVFLSTPMVHGVLSESRTQQIRFADGSFPRHATGQMGWPTGNAPAWVDSQSTALLLCYGQSGANGRYCPVLSGLRNRRIAFYASSANGAG